MALPDRLRLGTSSWSASSWEGTFYPKGTPSAEYLSFYSSRYTTVEVDATFYRIPGRRMVDVWRERTPSGFLFTAKVPQVITHEKLLKNCDDEMRQFLGVMARLGEKLGPLLLQFRYFRKAEFPSPDPFLSQLEKFLSTLPTEHRYAVEVRNRNFVTPRLLDILHRHRVALALIDHPWFFRIHQLMDIPGILTTDFAYLRWLGDRYKIEEQTKSWDRVIVDRTREMQRWVPAVREMLAQDRPVEGLVVISRDMAARC